MFSTETHFCFARAGIITAVYRQTEGEHTALRRAKALYAVLTEMPIFIRPGELIVGQRAALLAGRAVYPEYHLKDLTQAATPPEIWDYWRTRSLAYTTLAAHPKQLRAAERELAAGYVTSTDTGFGHVIVDYEKAITQGFNAIIAEAEGGLNTCPVEDNEGRLFLESVIIACRGIVAWAERYAALAEASARQETDPQRAAELCQIAAICRRVPAEPARSFHEALQAFWFVHIALHIEQFGWSISAGRFDQYMFPYFLHDLHTDVLTEDSAWELLLNLWVKFMENIDTGVKDTTFQNLTLGGADIHGADQSNILSFWCLAATRALRFNQPALSVRWHPGISPAFWADVLHTIAQGMGLPALFNDTVIIPALTTHGVSPEDAAGFGIVGCVEACVPGKMQGVTAGGHINLAKALELALNEGRSLISGEQIGLPTTDPATWHTFDDLWNAYTAQVQYLAGLNILAAIIAGKGQKRGGHCPLMSALLDDCLVKRRDLVYGGTRYNLPGIGIFGPSNVADGMIAIQKWVLDEKRVTFAELRHALQTDFAGQEGLRQMLANRTVRFGNDDPQVDSLINRINAVHAGYCWQHVDSRGGRFTCGVWPVNTHVHTGQWTGATPDGRHQGTPLVDGVGACQGADRKGPTALLTSVAKLNNIEHWTAGNTCNIKFSASSIHGTDGEAHLGSLVETFMHLGGQELQINVIDALTLRRAQQDPSAYTDLVIRVAGYSAYFTRLSKEVQDEIISRTEQVI